MKEIDDWFIQNEPGKWLQAHRANATDGVCHTVTRLLGGKGTVSALTITAYKGVSQDAWKRFIDTGHWKDADMIGIEVIDAVSIPGAVLFAMLDGTGEK